MRNGDFTVFVAPSLIVMGGLMLGPLLLTIFLSMHRVGFDAQWIPVGFDNFARLAAAPRFWRAFEFTLLYAAVTTPFQIALGFALALMLYEVPRGRGLFVGAFLMPFILTPVVGTLMFAIMSKDPIGFLVWLFSAIGIEISFMENTITARALILGYGIWYGAPFAFIVIYAALMTLPEEAIEAARVDGAHYGQRLRYIVVPYLRPVFLFVLVIEIINGFRLFDPVYVITRGIHGTETLSFYNYVVSFSQRNLGLGAAVSVSMCIALGILVLPLVLLTRRDAEAT